MNPNSNSKPSSPRSQLLLAEDLRKSYGAIAALRGLSFTLDAGRVLGFLGPNGAGKTTAIRILTTILEPDAGRFSIDGISSEFPEKIRRRIGVLPESLGFPKQMTGIEFLIYFAQLYGITAAEARISGAALLKEVGLEKRAKSLVGSYSRGMRQRLGIARALISDPVVLFLDEPTLGLDPRGQQELLDLVRRIARERNAGVVLCSHFLSEIEGFCDDVIILNTGRLVAAGTVADVIGQSRSRTGGIVGGNDIRIQVPPSALAAVRQILKAAPQVKKVTAADENGGWLEVELADPAGAGPAEEHLLRNQILDVLIRADIPILSFEAKSSRLQDVFFQLTGEANK